MPIRFLLPCLFILACCNGCTIALPMAGGLVGHGDRETVLRPPPDVMPVGMGVVVEMSDGSEVVGQLEGYDEAGRTLEVFENQEIGTLGALRTIPTDSVRVLRWKDPQSTGNVVVAGVVLDLAVIAVFLSTFDMGLE